MQAVPSERIELSCAINTPALGGTARWTTIPDESWGAIVSNPPTAIRVQVADLPGGAAARLEHYQTERDRRELQTLLW